MKEYDVCSSYLKAYISPPLAEFIPRETTLSPCKRLEKEQLPFSKARLVFVGGRGLKTKTNYLRLKALADKYGAVCGCTRPVAMNGWESYDNFIGISGVSLKNCVVVTFGVSGAGPFIKGIKDADMIISINNDANALIFDYSDYAMVTDCIKLISGLEKL